MYYITLTDYHGQRFKVEVSKEIFMVYEESRKKQISENHKRRKYIDKRGLDNPYVIQELEQGMKSVEEQYHIKEKLAQAFNIIDSCSLKQKERFILHTVYGFKCRDIAAFHGCSISVVHKSIGKVREKIKKFQKGG